MYNDNHANIKKGDVFFIELEREGVVGSEQCGTRPAICIQNNKGNTYSPTIIVALLTTKISKKRLPTHVPINIDEEIECTLNRNSLALCEQLRTIDKRRIITRCGHLSSETMRKIDIALKNSLALDEE